jgi:hypothetical protein
MGCTPSLLEISKFWLSSYLLNTKLWKKSAIKFVLCWNLMIKTGQSSFLPCFPYNPRAKLRLEVFFKKLHPRINRTTLFSTSLYLLNTIKPFLSHENRSLTKSKKNYTDDTLWSLNFIILSILFCFWIRYETKMPTDLDVKYFSGTQIRESKNIPFNLNRKMISIQKFRAES